jgi:hypothetical protein
MSGHPALGFYLESANEPPADVQERTWRGVLYRGNGYPEAFGASVLEGLGQSSGDLQRFVEMWITKPNPEWVSDEGTSELLVDNAAFCYVLEVAARRLDVFGTYVGADGVLLGSAFVDEAGRTTPASFDDLELPEGEDDEPSEEEWIAQVEEFFRAACSALNVDPARAKSALVYASELEARSNNRYRIDYESDLARHPSVASFSRAGARYSIKAQPMLELVDHIGSEILRTKVPDEEFLLAPVGSFWQPSKIHTFLLRRPAATLPLSVEERRTLQGDAKHRKGIAEPYIACDWCVPFILWADAVRRQA